MSAIMARVGTMKRKQGGQALPTATPAGAPEHLRARKGQRPDLALAEPDEPAELVRQRLMMLLLSPLAEGNISLFLQDIGLPALLCDSEGNLLRVNSQATLLLGSKVVPGGKIQELAIVG